MPIRHSGLGWMQSQMLQPLWKLPPARDTHFQQPPGAVTCGAKAVDMDGVLPMAAGIGLIVLIVVGSVKVMLRPADNP